MGHHKPVTVVMGSQSDWDTMRHCSQTLKQLDIEHDSKVVSAHRTPDWLFDFASTAIDEGYQIIIAGAGGAAHLPGMLAAKTILPVIGVPIKSSALNGIDSLLSIGQMPAGISVSTMAIGKPGAINAALTAASILSLVDPLLRDRFTHYRTAQTQKVLANISLDEA